MAASISYNNWSFSGPSGYPVPAVSISQEFQRDGAGRHIGTTASITLEGKIYSGSGNKGFDHLLVLESGLRNVFSRDGGNLSISCGTATSIFSGIKIGRYSANKTEDQWTTTIDYSIDLTSEIANTGSGIFFVSSTQDDWNIETIDEHSYVNSSTALNVLGFGNLSFAQGNNYPFYRISRTLGAVGKFIPEPNNEVSGTTKTAVKHAKDWVNFHLPLPPQYTGIINGLNLYNFVRSVNASDTEGSYRITDNWIGIPTATALPYTESFTIESSVDSSMLRTVTVNGTVKGLEPFQTGNIYNKNVTTYLDGNLSSAIAPTNTANIRVNNSAKFNNAISGYNSIRCAIYSRASALSHTGITCGNSGFSSRFVDGRTSENVLNPIPVSITEGFNPAEGGITYSYSYNNRTLNFISGSISETITVDDTLPTSVVASVFVLGRSLGPILQDLGTTTSYSRAVTVEVILPRPQAISPTFTFPVDSYNALVDLFDKLDPSKLNPAAIRSFVKQNSENWNVLEGRFTKQKTWEWTKCM